MELNISNKINDSNFIQYSSHLSKSELEDMLTNNNNCIYLIENNQVIAASEIKQVKNSHYVLNNVYYENTNTLDSFLKIIEKHNEFLFTLIPTSNSDQENDVVILQLKTSDFNVCLKNKYRIINQQGNIYTMLNAYFK